MNAALELKNITRSYPHFTLDGVNLRLEKGQIMGLIGPNGAGKSTTIRIAMGLVKPDSGQVEVLGQQMPQEQVGAKYHIGYASEDMRLYKRATVQWHMDFIRSIYPQQWDSAYADTLLKRFDIRPQLKTGGLSHGQRVKAGLLLILARRPALLILDEPTTGLDPVARMELLKELMAVMADEERSVLLSSHNTQDIEQLSDTIAFIDRGRVISSQDKETYLEQWWRLRLRGDANAALPQHASIASTTVNRSLVTVLVRGAHQPVQTLYQQSGFETLAVERLSLEEIFVAEVERSRAATGEYQ